jgi:putative effector of murein hydrolase
MLILSWLLTLTVGLPLRYSTPHSDVALATLLLFATWLTTLAIQSSIKSSPALPQWQRTLLSGLLNPVLWTSLVMTAYVFLDSTLSNRPLKTMLDTLQTHTTLSTLLLHTSNPPHLPTPTSSPTIASGDVAIAILNAGLAAWGLKLYEYRTHLLSRAGLSVCTVAAAMALGNVCCAPLLAHALGVQPASRALAFAARSVTIALANPVMSVLGGDAGLNAAMVVVSGIVYQMGLGFGVGGWLEGRVVERMMGRLGVGLREVEVEGGSGSCRDGDDGVEGRGRDGTEIGAARAQQRANDPRIVAAGVTVGINGAAMGTAYLYEAQSEAAPHAALSMMALGVMTVVFSSISPLARWVMDSVSA